MRLPPKLASMIAQEPDRGRAQRLVLTAYKRGLREGSQRDFLTTEDMALMRWCVLTVAKGFVAGHEGSVAANHLLKRLDDKTEAAKLVARDPATTEEPSR